MKSTYLLPCTLDAQSQHLPEKPYTPYIQKSKKTLFTLSLGHAFSYVKISTTHLNINNLCIRQTTRAIWIAVRVNAYVPISQDSLYVLLSFEKGLLFA
jgi:hypothetical protein